MNFKQWIDGLESKTAIVHLPEKDEIVINIPKELQHEKILEGNITCNECQTGSTTLFVYTKELSFALHDGDIFRSDMLDKFTEEELKGFSRLVDAGVIIQKVY